MYAVDTCIATQSGLVRDSFRHPETLDRRACETVTAGGLKPAKVPACPCQSKNQEDKGASQMTGLRFIRRL